MNDDGAQRTHAIVSNLIRALTHKIRTPLSVISNEIEALRALLPATELESARQRVTQIADVLKSLNQFAVSPSPKQRFDVVEVLRDIAAAHKEKVMLGEQGFPIPVLGDRRMFSLALSSLASLLLQLGPVRIEVRTASPGVGTILFRSDFKTFLEDPKLTTWASLSDFFNDELDLDSFLPSCIDSILLAQSVTVSVASQVGIEITLHFSLCE